MAGDADRAGHDPRRRRPEPPGGEPTHFLLAPGLAAYSPPNQGLSWTSAPQVVCRDCLAKVKQGLKVQSGEDQADAELDRMKKAMKGGR